MRICVRLFVLGLILADARAAVPPPIASFVEQNCTDCHDADTKKGGLDLTALAFSPDGRLNFATWVKIYDRVASGEMPPKKRERPPAADLQMFTNTIASALLAADEKRIVTDGRALKRRLNRYEYEDTLRDVLSLPYLEVKGFLPEDTEANGFNKTGEALDVSHVQMARYLKAADFALHEALAPSVTRPEKTVQRYYAWDQIDFVKHINQMPELRRTYPLQGLELKREYLGKGARQIPGLPQAVRQTGAMGMLMSTYEPTYVRFGSFHAPISGRYRVRLSAYSFWISTNLTSVSKGHRPEPVTLYAETPPEQLRKLGDFDVNADPTMREMEVFLIAGETIRPDASRLFRPRPMGRRNANGDATGMPGVAFQWLEVEGPLLDQWPPAGHQLLFGDLPLAAGKADDGVEVISKNPEADAPRLLRGFMQQAYRRPVTDADEQRILELIRTAQKSGYNFTAAMLAGYTAVLCSPDFLYLDQQSGRLADRALAERLSYFLWNSRPDETLRQLAAKQQLHQPEVLRQQTERLLNDPRSQRFVHDFLNYWLDLRQIDSAAPDAELYPEYQLDDLLVESMTAETQLFFAELLKRNLSATNLIGSDFAMLNERLAVLYGIPGVDGVKLRPVKLPPGGVRGGLLTQASVLKVTANGTTTSPVTRGVWIMGRLLGRPPPPPPPSVPAVEPDTRGVTTIRDQLAKHRTQETCNACHRNIDPAGFALESFDVMGAWRDRYRSLGDGEPVQGAGHNGRPFTFKLGPPVDPSGELPDGRKFQNVGELRALLLQDPDQLARNLVQQLSIYATGAPVGFADRAQIANILVQTKPENYGVRSLVQALVQSELFLNK